MKKEEARIDCRPFRRCRVPGSSRIAVMVMSLFFLFILLPAPAGGFQFYFFFAGPSSSGEGGDRYFTGSPRYKLYNCRICHLFTPTEIRVSLRTEPEDIFLLGYRPGTTYEVHVELEDELRAPAVKFFSTNNFCLEVLDALNRNAGVMDTGWPTEPPISQLFRPVVLSPDRTVVMSGPFNTDLSWNWSWTAPPPGTGGLTFYLGFVDGNGDLKAFSDNVSVQQRKTFERP
jgi:hypothetical protein